METTVSIPGELAARIDQLARRAGQSPSELVHAALREYLARHAPDEITAALDQVCSEVGSQLDPAALAAARQTLARIEW